MRTSAPSRTSPRTMARTPATNSRTTNGSVTASQTIAAREGRSAASRLVGAIALAPRLDLRGDRPTAGSTSSAAATTATGMGVGGRSLGRASASVVGIGHAPMLPSDEARSWSGRPSHPDRGASGTSHRGVRTHLGVEGELPMKILLAVDGSDASMSAVAARPPSAHAHRIADRGRERHPRYLRPEGARGPTSSGSTHRPTATASSTTSRARLMEHRRSRSGSSCRP